MMCPVNEGLGGKWGQKAEITDVCVVPGSVQQAEMGSVQDFISLLSR